jgi:hypothetical protein
VAETLFDVQAPSVKPTTSGIDWGAIGTNVFNTIASAGLGIGAAALQQQIAGRIQQVKPAVEAAQRPAVAPSTVQQAPASGWQKYMPLALGGAAVLGVAYFAFGRRR